MKLNLSQASHNLLKFVLSNTGEQEIDRRGIEVDAPRRLNGEESAQRRHYLKKINPTIEANTAKFEEFRKTAKKTIDDAIELWKKENPKDEKEEQKDYDKKLNDYLATRKDLNDLSKEIQTKFNEMQKSMIEADLTDKTIEVVKKYYKEFGDKVGYTSGDDEAVEEIEKELNK